MTKKLKDKYSSYFKFKGILPKEEYAFLDIIKVDNYFARYNSTYDYFNAVKERGKVIVALIRPDDAEYLFLSFFRKEPSKKRYEIR